jgi:hypothetical protein
MAREYDESRAASALAGRLDPRFASAIEHALAHAPDGRTRAVVFTYDPDEAESLWLVRDYLPELADLAHERFPAIEELVAALGAAEASVERVPVPYDCRDGLLGAFWRRPERYLDPALRRHGAPLAGIETGVLQRALDELRTDLDGGAWRRRYGGLLGLEELDVGYRLVTADLAPLRG